MVENQLTLVYFDTRWYGAHGIGRFAQEINKRINLRAMNIGGSPVSPTDPLRLLAKMLIIPKNMCIFTPGYNVPLYPARKFLFTLHDLYFVDYHRNYSFLKYLYFQVLVRNAARNTYKILTVSQFSKERIAQWAAISPDKVMNVGNGVDRSVYNPYIEPYEFGYPYILCVSNRKPHKNEARLIKAFALSKIQSQTKLVFTGIPNPSILGVCKLYNLGNRVIFTGYVTDKDMPRLYRGAIALVFPSLYEGFGLPALEAMACGTPVIASNIPPLQEVTGGAAILVDPYSVEEIALNMERVCSDEALREHLSRKGIERASLYSWDNVVERIRGVLIELVGS